MPELTLQQSLDLALRHHQAGRGDQAEAIYRQILTLQPNDDEALHLLGVLLGQKGQFVQSMEFLQRAILIEPKAAVFYVNLGMTLEKLGFSYDAVNAYREAIRLQPIYAEAYVYLGLIFRKQGRINEAIQALSAAIKIKPGMVEAYCNLGLALIDKGRFKLAIRALRKALDLAPNLIQAHCNLGIALDGVGRLDEAISEFKQALSLKPDAQTYSNLGHALKRQEQLDQAIEAFTMALKLDPNLVSAHFNLGAAFKSQGLIQEAVDEFQSAMRVNPHEINAHSNLIFAMLHHPAYDARAVYQEQRRFNQLHAEPLKGFITAHANNRDPQRRLKIGYVSADFINHASAFFLIPLLRSHDHQQFEIFCFSQVSHPDQFTAQFRPYADQWRNIVRLTDQQVAERIRGEQIDVLVDLKLHTAENRLKVFAYKPAPVQVAWLGYPGGTGLDAMDYRLTDPYLDPPGLDDEFYSEESVRLPDCFWCYDPLLNEYKMQSLEISELPALKNGFVTFGCLNQFTKINSHVLDVWGQILSASPNSRLLLIAPEGLTRERVLAQLGRHQIAPARVEFFPRQLRSIYLKRHHRIDVALDPFPCNGHTTTFDLLWMGVPLVTLSGKTAMGRAGKSILSNIGLSELVAQTPEEYVRIALDLAGDLPRLSELRRTLRRRMEASPLMDARRFARNIEAAYRDMWRKWCNCAAKPHRE